MPLRVGIRTPTSLLPPTSSKAAMARPVPFVRTARPRRRPVEASAFPEHGTSRVGWWLYLMPGARAADRDRDRAAGVEHLPQLHRVPRHPAPAVHRARELGRALSRRRLLDVVPQQPRDDRRDGDRADDPRAAHCRSCCSTSSASKFGGSVGELPAGHLLPAADLAGRDRRHRDRLDPAARRTAPSTRSSRPSASATSRTTGSAAPTRR